MGSTTLKVVVLDDHDNICFSTYVRHNARIRETLSVVFSELGERFGDELFSLTITGSVGLGIAERTQIPFVQEVVASTAYVRRYHPQATTLIDIGGEDAKVVFLKGETPDMRMNSNCAGGTGAFIDQMALCSTRRPPDSTVWRSGPSAFIRLPRGAAFSPKRTSRTCWPKT